jgi:argininosuccinate synthase
MLKKEVKKVVLAYSGGLDTSIILKWLQDEYKCEVVTFTADLGQGEEVEPARKKALAMGIKEENIFILDLQEEFVKDFVFPMFRANTIYEGEYLLGTSIARPLIAKKQIEIAKITKADGVSHGATGKGNDQVRFELGYLGLNGDIKVIAPWREWDLNSREKLLKYALEHGINIEKKKDGGSPYSMDANLLHISYEGLLLEDPNKEPEDDMWLWTTKPEDAPDKAEYITIDYKFGDPIAINGKKMSPATILKTLNKYGKKHGIGRIDIVENRFVGMKARGCYETPGGTIMLKAHRAIESITLDREAMHLKDELMPRYAKLIYNGFWWSPEREMLQEAINNTQKFVEGSVRLKLYKGNVIVVGRESPTSLFSEAHSTFEEDEVYNQSDAEGFIKLNALRLIIESQKRS